MFQLPMYAEDIPVKYTFVPDDPLPLQGTVSKVRKALVHKYDAFAVRSFLLTHLCADFLTSTYAYTLYIRL